MAGLSPGDRPDRDRACHGRLGTSRTPVARGDPAARARRPCHPHPARRGGSIPGNWISYRAHRAFTRLRGVPRGHRSPFAARARPTPSEIDEMARDQTPEMARALSDSTRCAPLRGQPPVPRHPAQRRPATASSCARSRRCRRRSSSSALHDGRGVRAPRPPWVNSCPP